MAQNQSCKRDTYWVWYEGKESTPYEGKDSISPEDVMQLAVPILTERTLYGGQGEASSCINVCIDLLSDIWSLWPSSQA